MNDQHFGLEEPLNTPVAKDEAPLSDTQMLPPSVPPAPSTGYEGLQKALTIGLAVFGGIVFLFASLSWFQTGRMLFAGGPQESYVADANGVTELDIRVSAASLEIVFDDVEEAALVVPENAGRTWRLKREGTRLLVSSQGHGQNRVVPSFRLGDFGVSTLYLPSQLGQGTTKLQLSVGAGSAEVEGDFSVVSADVGAGSLSLAGRAEEVVLRVEAGEIDATFRDTARADLNVAAGEARVDLEGRAPEHLKVDVAVGSALLRVPDVPYHVVTERSMGDIELTIDQTGSSKGRTIEASVALGTIRITP